MTVTELQTKTALELYDTLLDGDAPFILDVRNPVDFERWHIECRSNLEVLNLPYYDFIEDEDAAIAQLPVDKDCLLYTSRCV